MGTSDTALAVDLLGALDALRIEYRVLHRADDIRSRAPISDVDIVVRDPPREVLRRLVQAQANHGLAPLMLWEYDVGSLTSFWSTRDGADGVQLDLLCDPGGRNRYGLRTDVVLADDYSSTSAWPSRLDDPARLVYLLSKRVVKGDRERAAAVAAELRQRFGVERAMTVAGAILRPGAVRRCWRAMEGTYPYRVAPLVERWRDRVSARGLRRLRRPTGALVLVSDGDRHAATALAERFGRFLVRAQTVRTPQALRERWRIWWALRTPTLLLAVPTVASGCPPLHVADLDGAAVVAELETSVRRSLGVPSHAA